MAQWEKSLLREHEDMSSKSQRPHRVGCYKDRHVISGMGWETGTKEAWGPANLMHAAANSSEQGCSQTSVIMLWHSHGWLYFLRQAGTHTYIHKHEHTCAHTHTHTHTHTHIKTNPPQRSSTQVEDFSIAYLPSHDVKQSTNALLYKGL